MPKGNEKSSDSCDTKGDSKDGNASAPSFIERRTESP